MFILEGEDVFFFYGYRDKYPSRIFNHSTDFYLYQRIASLSAHRIRCNEEKKNWKIVESSIVV